MARLAIGLVAAALLALAGCNEQHSPMALASAAPPKIRDDKLPPQPEPELEPYEPAPWEDPWKIWRRQNAQTLHEWVLHMQSRYQLEFVAFDHNRLHGLAPLLEFVPYNFYLMVVGDYPLMGEMQALFLFTGGSSRFPYANVVRFASPPTEEQTQALLHPRVAHSGIIRPHGVWVEDCLAVAGSSSAERFLGSPSHSAIMHQLELAGDHALIAALAVDDSMRTEAATRVISLGGRKPLESRWLRLQTRLSAIITVADVDPQLCVQLRLHPYRSEQTAAVARELQSLLQTLQAHWSSSDLAGYERTHETPTDPLLWELVRRMLSEAQVFVDVDGVVVARWTADPAFRERLVSEGPELAQQLQRRAFERLRPQRMAGIGLALAAYLQHHHDAFPEDVRDGDGKPLLSWRVELLPFFDSQQAKHAYRNLHRNEPWDSPHNAAVLATLPPDLFAVNTDTPAGHADVLAVRGPGIGFLPEQGHARLATHDITDGLSQTVLLIEVAPQRAVPIGQPGDLAFEEVVTGENLGGPDEEHFYAMLGSTEVVPVPKRCDPAILAAMLGRADGEDWQLGGE